MDPRQHWEGVYGRHAPDAVSWYAPHLTESLALIRRTGLPSTAAVIDVGGGGSTLVDDLLEAGYTDVSVLDLSSTALEVSRKRLGDAARRVRWIAGDVLSHAFAPRSVDLWHDRAVFHFLTEASQRQAYVASVVGALRPGGHAIVGTFGPEGPQRCSGLPVMRYAAQDLHGEFGAAFRLLHSSQSVHTTPAGTAQPFVYGLFRLER